MKNKKALMFRYMIIAIISLLVLFVIAGPIIKGIFVDKQIAFAGSKTEEITTDCDGDGIIVGDFCPCVFSQKESDDLPCESADPVAIRTCPTLCKAIV